MRDSRRAALIGAFVLALAGRGASADDQTTTISQQGDALARATSAQALVKPMPAFPPNSPSNVSTTAADRTPVVAPRTSSTPAPRAAVPREAPSAPAASAPLVVATAAGSAAAPLEAPSSSPAEPPSGLGKAALIAVGALVALGLFLWERRKGGP